MRLTDPWLGQDLRDSLTGRPGRTALTVFAVGIGILSLAILMAILGGLREQTARIIDRFGADVLMIHDVGDDRNADLDGAFVRQLEGLMPGAVVCGVRSQPGHDARGFGRLRIISAGPGLGRIRGWIPREGRLLDAADRREGQYHCVINESLAGRAGVQPGQMIPLASSLLQVVGIIGDDEAASMTGSADGAENMVWVADTVVLSGDRSSPRPDRFHAVLVRHPPGWTPPAAASRIRSAFPDTRITITTPDSLVARTRTLRNTVRIVYGSVAMLCLLLGGTTLMSLMTANVQERVPEIGLRMAIGARVRDIRNLFLLEGAVLTLAAGLAGILGALLIVAIAGNRLDVPLRIDAATLIIPLTAAALLGLVFAWFPARTAAAITPADSLRVDG